MYKNHRGSNKSAKVEIFSEQIFVQKAKDIVFAEPTLTSLINKSLFKEWVKDSNTLNDWSDTFAAAENSTFMEEIKKNTFEQTKK